ncbi:ABC transporter permease subunit [Paenibacillus sp. LMG 31456]|uniref:ABC transporter permease subunit n=1 Tax=Paenibacillus foliorum TaxID=2654974 RepID=A0A972H087_9BACL|nr:ABC transporter permease [Paenibacillus foliorum]NOU97844.1 ABC transporter permease subunit [Paenibacillus foliorum]
MKKILKDTAALISIIIFGCITVLALLAPVLTSYRFDEMVNAPLLSPSAQYLLGTDEIGRDIFTRIVYAGRVSLIVGISATMIAMAGGIVLGLISGYYGGKIDSIISRFLDGLLAFPSIILALAVMAVLGPDIYNAMLAIGIVSIPIFARITRSSVLTIKSKEFVEASRSMGAEDCRIMFRVILPNCFSPILVQISLTFASAVLTEAALSFLGLGVQPPTPSWGSMLNASRTFLSQAPLYCIVSGAAVFSTVLCLNVLGDSLRDLFDPREIKKRA